VKREGEQRCDAKNTGSGKSQQEKDRGKAGIRIEREWVPQFCHFGGGKAFQQPDTTTKEKKTKNYAKKQYHKQRTVTQSKGGTKKKKRGRLAITWGRGETQKARISMNTKNCKGDDAKLLYGGGGLRGRANHIMLCKTSGHRRPTGKDHEERGPI